MHGKVGIKMFAPQGIMTPMSAMNGRRHNTRGRPPKPPKHLKAENLDVYLPKEAKDRFRDYVAQIAPSSSMSEVAAEILVEKMDAATRPAQIPLYGVIAAGDPIAIQRAPEGTAFLYPSFRLPTNSYALVVVGNSMERATGLSIPHGSYALFRADEMPPDGTIVHVEFHEPSGEHTCSLKRYRSQPDGGAVFEPLNHDHEPIIAPAGTYTIKGVFLRAWEGNHKKED